MKQINLESRLNKLSKNQKLNFKNDLKVLSLFSGCGGMDLAFESHKDHKGDLLDRLSEKNHTEKRLRKTVPPKTIEANFICG